MSYVTQPSISVDGARHVKGSCAGCDKTVNQGVKLSRCSGCLLEYYCVSSSLDRFRYSQLAAVYVPDRVLPHYRTHRANHANELAGNTTTR